MFLLNSPYDISIDCLKLDIVSLLLLNKIINTKSVNKTMRFHEGFPGKYAETRICILVLKRNDQTTNLELLVMV